MTGRVESRPLVALVRHRLAERERATLRPHRPQHRHGHHRRARHRRGRVEPAPPRRHRRHERGVHGGCQVAVIVLGGGVTVPSGGQRDQPVEPVRGVHHLHLHGGVGERAAGAVHPAGEHPVPGLAVVIGHLDEHRLERGRGGVDEGIPPAIRERSRAGDRHRAGGRTGAQAQRVLVCHRAGQVASHVDSHGVPPEPTPPHPAHRGGHAGGDTLRTNGRIRQHHVLVGADGHPHARAGVCADKRGRVRLRRRGRVRAGRRRSWIGGDGSRV